MTENTLLGRCTAALSDAYELAGPLDDWTELARILATEGRSCQPEPVEAYNDHPSLTAAERNPSMK